MHLNNRGLYYDINFSHQSEFDSIAWLAKMAIRTCRFFPIITR